MRNAIQNLFWAIVVVVVWEGNIYSQDPPGGSDPIAIVSRNAKDSIKLRWAPLNYSVWLAGNTSGYIVERFTITRNGLVLTPPEKTTLTPSPLKPWPEQRWQSLVSSNKYAAIAAQALYGDRFEVNLKQSDIFSILNKSRENEQRFAFALFCADVSPQVAGASALSFTDQRIGAGEKYLYRVIVRTGNSQELRGNIFVDPTEIYELPKLQIPEAELMNGVVSLKWPASVRGGYTAFFIERSHDGKLFSQITEEPVATAIPAAHAEPTYEYATDTIKVTGKLLYYRIRGINAFGDVSEPSPMVTIMTTKKLSEVPYIRKCENIDNNSIRISWEYPEKYNQAIKGFKVERGLNPNGLFTPITQNMLPPDQRTVVDDSPGISNYYRVMAQGVNDEQLSSPLYLSQLVDSIPPAVPKELKAMVSESGEVRLSWAPNSDPDIFGYRVYQANIEKEELTQLTIGPAFGHEFIHRIDLTTLNRHIDYSVMAIDASQNHSALSTLLKVPLPDKVKPMAPIMLPVRSGTDGIRLSWYASASADVARYVIHRATVNENVWSKLDSVRFLMDSIYYFNDARALSNVGYYYRIIAVDEAGLLSEPSAAVTGIKTDNTFPAPIKWRDPIVNQDRKEVVLTWDYSLSGVKQFQIYKAEGEGPAARYRSVTGSLRVYRDQLVIGKEFKYRIVAIFDNGSMSEMSRELSVRY